MPTRKHRGRLQAQGPDTEKSESWSREEPLTKAEGLSLLDRLWNRLTQKEREDRSEQFDRTRRFIENVEGGVDAPLGKSFVNRKKHFSGVKEWKDLTEEERTPEASTTKK